MPRTYHLRTLSQETAPLAYPLIQAAWPEVSLDAWIDYTKQVNRTRADATPSAGIVAAENGRGYIHGLFSYSVQPVLNHQSVLAVDNFIALDTGDRAAAIRSLIDGMENLARNLDCSAIHTQIPDEWATGYPAGGNLLAHLRDAGHNPQYVKLCKVVGQNINVAKIPS